LGKNRLEAFSDGVIAIIITITVLGLRPPHGTSLGALRTVLPVFLSYALSFSSQTGASSAPWRRVNRRVVGRSEPELLGKPARLG
jgi:hypothetical protein